MHRQYRKLIVVLVLCYNLCVNNNNCVVMGASPRTNNEQVNCDLVRPFFDTRNISVTTQDENKYGPVCNAKCCSVSMEVELRHQVKKEFSSLLRHNSRSLLGLLHTTASTLQDHVINLTRQSENKTLVLFSQVYRRMSILSQEPISALYADVRQSIRVNDTFTDAYVDVKTSVQRFFTDLFPLVYHHNVNTQHSSRDFSAAYKVCLRETIDEIQPFGDIPKQIANTLAKSLDATRLLLQSLAVGVEVLNATETLLTHERSDVECHDALLKMSYCPKCHGFVKETKPCSGYCLNVLRGCLTRHVTDLDTAWGSYVEAVERLVIAWKQHNNEAGVNADAVIRALDTRISEAIMYAMETTPELDKRVKRACGLPKLSDKEDDDKVTQRPIETSNTSSSVSKSLKPQRMSIGSMRDNPPPETQLLHFLASIAKTRGFYTNLADNLCKYESFAETKDANCWNGDRIGEYTKTVVDSGLGMQKYNPELTISAEMQTGNPKIANLADKLRHVHNMVITSLGSVSLPESDSFMQGDAADGSGSGERETQTSDDEDEDSSGSGYIPQSGISPDVTQGPRNVDIIPTTAGTTSTLLKSNIVTTIFLLASSIWRIYRCIT